MWGEGQSPCSCWLRDHQGWQSKDTSGKGSAIVWLNSFWEGHQRCAQHQYPHTPRSRIVSLAGTCWRAWPSPALLRDPLRSKLLIYMDSSCSKQWEQQGEQQGFLYLSKLLPHISVSSSSNTLEQGMLPMAAP